MEVVERFRRELSAYFCEDEATFKLDDCIKTFSAFFDSFLKAVEVFLLYLPNVYAKQLLLRLLDVHTCTYIYIHIRRCIIF